MKDVIMKDVIIMDGVTAGYKDRLILRNLSFTVQKGEFIGIIGPNGVGKSSLFKLLLGLLAPQTGEIEILGLNVRHSIKKIRERTGYLPQRNNSDPRFPILVKEVVLMGLYSSLGIFRQPQPEDYQRVKDVLIEVGMKEFYDFPFGHLSGGQQQRVLLARALVRKPELLLLDEPITGIDPTTQYRLIQLINNVRQKYGITVMMVTHHLYQIQHLLDRLLYLEQNFYELGRPEMVMGKYLGGEIDV